MKLIDNEQQNVVTLNVETQSKMFAEVVSPTTKPVDGSLNSRAFCTHLYTQQQQMTCQHWQTPI